MNHQKVLDVLLYLEKQLDVNAYWIDGVQVWPILRRDIWMYLLKQDNVPNLVRPSREGPKGRVPSKNGLTRAKKTKNELEIIESLTRKLSKTLQHSKILFWSRKDDHTEAFVDGSVDRIIDPLIWDAKEKGVTCLKLSREDGVNWAKTNQLEHSVKVALDQFHEVRTISPPIGCAKDLLESITAIVPGISVTHAHIVSAVRRVNSRADYFDIILEIINPRLVMLGVFYSADAMALIHACRRRGLPVVDIQHGKQGLYHAMYGSWSVLPPNGYSVLPDIFWTWGEESRAVIQTSLPCNCIRPRAIVGGNRWLARWKAHKNTLTCSTEVQELLSKMKTFERTILVSLQPTSDPLPDLLIEAMKQAPDDWLWLLRAHPHQGDLINGFEMRIRAAGLIHYEIRTASNAPLYPLLVLADLHVTSWSSVAYEALSLRTPTILIAPTAKQLYADYINRGLFDYAESSIELLDMISKRSYKQIPIEDIPYIETDDALAQKAMRTCFIKRL